jgi:hypothetical protein
MTPALFKRLDAFGHKKSPHCWCELSPTDWICMAKVAKPVPDFQIFLEKKEAAPLRGPLQITPKNQMKTWRGRESNPQLWVMSPANYRFSTAQFLENPPGAHEAEALRVLSGVKIVFF